MDDELEYERQLVVIDYTNHRGERSKRTIRPVFVRFGVNEWHPEAQWLLDAWDVEKDRRRTFAMKGIHSWRPKLAPANEEPAPPPP